MGQEQTKKPVKVIMWSTPRALSTVIEKCLSCIPGSVIWHEPYVNAMWFGTDRHSTAPGDKGGWAATDEDNTSVKVADIQLPEDVGYDGYKCSYGWCKEQLEAE